MPPKIPPRRKVIEQIEMQEGSQWLEQHQETFAEYAASLLGDTDLGEYTREQIRLREEERQRSTQLEGREQDYRSRMEEVRANREPIAIERRGGATNIQEDISGTEDIISMQRVQQNISGPRNIFQLEQRQETFAEYAASLLGDTDLGEYTREQIRLREEERQRSTQLEGREQDYRSRMEEVRANREPIAIERRGGATNIQEDISGTEDIMMWDPSDPSIPLEEPKTGLGARPKTTSKPVETVHEALSEQFRSMQRVQQNISGPRNIFQKIDAIFDRKYYDSPLLEMTKQLTNLPIPTEAQAPEIQRDISKATDEMISQIREKTPQKQVPLEFPKYYTDVLNKGTIDYGDRANPYTVKGGIQEVGITRPHSIESTRRAEATIRETTEQLENTYSKAILEIATENVKKILAQKKQQRTQQKRIRAIEGMEQSRIEYRARLERIEYAARLEIEEAERETAREAEREAASQRTMESIRGMEQARAEYRARLEIEETAREAAREAEREAILEAASQRTMESIRGMEQARAEYRARLERIEYAARLEIEEAERETAREAEREAASQRTMESIRGMEQARAEYRARLEIEETARLEDIRARTVTSREQRETIETERTEELPEGRQPQVARATISTVSEQDLKRATVTQPQTDIALRRIQPVETYMQPTTTTSIPEVRLASPLISTTPTVTSQATTTIPQIQITQNIQQPVGSTIEDEMAGFRQRLTALRSGPDYDPAAFQRGTENPELRQFMTEIEGVMPRATNQEISGVERIQQGAGRITERSATTAIEGPSITTRTPTTAAETPSRQMGTTLIESAEAEYTATTEHAIRRLYPENVPREPIPEDARFVKPDVIDEMFSSNRFTRFLGKKTRQAIDVFTSNESRAQFARSTLEQLNRITGGYTSGPTYRAQPAIEGPIDENNNIEGPMERTTTRTNIQRPTRSEPIIDLEMEDISGFTVRQPTARAGTTVTEEIAGSSERIGSRIGTAGAEVGTEAAATGAEVGTEAGIEAGLIGVEAGLTTAETGLAAAAASTSWIPVVGEIIGAIAGIVDIGMTIFGAISGAKSAKSAEEMRAEQETSKANYWQSQSEQEKKKQQNVGMTVVYASTRPSFSGAGLRLGIKTDPTRSPGLYI